MNRIAMWLLVLGLLATVGLSTASPGRAKDAKDTREEKKPRPKFTVGKETTYATGPLDKDGYMNYAAALNDRLGKGVTPENNANVLLWKAFGPHPEGVTMLPEFFERMGIEPPPERGDYFVGLHRYAKEHLKIDAPERRSELDEQLDRAMQRPWMAKQYPEISAWLQANEKPLAVVVEATGPPQYFSPLVIKSTSGLLGALMPGVQISREFAAALTARAMLRVGEGRPEAGWQDLQACHQLGRQVARGGVLIEALVGIGIDSIASRADLGFLAEGKLDAGQVKACLRDLRKLPPMPPVADKIDLGERFMFLDCVMLIAHGDIDALEGLSRARTRPPDPKVRRFLADVDWDPALRNGNRWYDRLAAAMRLEDRSAREKELDRIEEDLKALKGNFGKSVDVMKIILGADGSGAARGKVLGDILIGLLMPAVRKVQQAGERTEQTQRNLHLAFALAAHQRQHGRYPATLAALAPDFLPAVPQDLFSGKALIYRPSKDGYLLYSVGLNGRDEQGRSYDDDPPGDDLTVRMPLPKLRRK